MPRRFWTARSSSPSFFAAQPKAQATTAAVKTLRLIDALEENDDVQEVYANFDIPEQVMEAVAT